MKKSNPTRELMMWDKDQRQEVERQPNELSPTVQASIDVTGENALNTKMWAVLEGESQEEQPSRQITEQEEQLELLKKMKLSMVMGAS
jgi:hypothetical protein